MKKKSVGKIIGIVLWVIAGLFVLLCVFSNLIRAGVLAVLFAVAGLAARFMGDKADGKSKTLFTVSVLITVFGLFVSLCFPPLGMSTHSKWKYPVMKTVTSCFRNIREPEWFPDFLGDVEKEFSFEYMPAIMQGNGYYDVRFVTRPKNAQQYVDSLAPTAIEVMSLQDYLNGNYQLKDSYSPNFRVDSNDSFWSGNVPGTMVYILDTNYYSHRGHEDVVVVNVEAGRVQLFSD